MIFCGRKRPISTKGLIGLAKGHGNRPWGHRNAFALVMTVASARAPRELLLPDARNIHKGYR